VRRCGGGGSSRNKIGQGSDGSVSLWESTWREEASILRWNQK